MANPCSRDTGLWRSKFVPASYKEHLLLPKTTVQFPSKLSVISFTLDAELKCKIAQQLET